MNIVLWSKSWYKGRLLKHVLLRLDIDPNIVYCDVNSEVSEQPCARGETKLWSYNRAKNAIQQYSEVDLSCGIEFGYEPEWEEFQCIVFVCLIDKSWRVRYGQSSTFLLPQKFKNALLLWAELKDVYFDREKNKQLSNVNIEVNRYLRKDDLIVEALQSAFVSYLAYYL